MGKALLGMGGVLLLARQLLFKSRRRCGAHIIDFRGPCPEGERQDAQQLRAPQHGGVTKLAEVESAVRLVECVVGLLNFLVFELLALYKNI
jgi:hypothetical protein